VSGGGVVLGLGCDQDFCPSKLDFLSSPPSTEKHSAIPPPPLLLPSERHGKPGPKLSKKFVLISIYPDRIIVFDQIGKTVVTLKMALTKLKSHGPPSHCLQLLTLELIHKTRIHTLTFSL
jgi:hypothetical protein